MATISEALAMAVQHHQSGRLEAAEQIYQRILAVEPNQPDALHFLGVLTAQLGRRQDAANYIQRAIAANPSAAPYHLNLGLVYQESGRLGEAIACYRRALELQPEFVEAHYNLGNALTAQGLAAEAEACYRRALQLRPGYAEAHYNLGKIKHDQGRLDEAAACYQRALELRPDLAEAHNNLGTARAAQEKLDEAAACYRRALQLNPDYADAHRNLGNVFTAQDRLDEAIACYRRVVQLKPELAEAHCNLGNALLKQRQFDAAAVCYRRALELQPDRVEAHFNLGNAFKERGELDEAIACYRRATELEPDHPAAHDNLVYTLLFSPAYDAETIHEELCRWNRQHAEPLARLVQSHSNDRSPERRLRVGYLSPDFRAHPVGLFMLPLLEKHDRGNFEIFCYASQDASDGITARCRAVADVWQNVRGLSDEQLADAIRRDRIDVLVDLTMHMANNRLLVFARKPAPVQVTYLAYCGTTGLETMDYRLTDPFLDPPGSSERFYSERTVRLPETYWCYQPAVQTPPANGSPAMAGEPVTFGCMNNFCKVTAPTLAAWSRLLQMVPRSRLLLHVPAGEARKRVRDTFAEEGVSSERLMFTEQLPITDYFRIYERVDVALDPSPYGGGTTTCDALWMGVPVVSLAGQLAVGRGGASILTNLGLTDLVAHDWEQYVRIAVDLARDLPRLGTLRATMRRRMQDSPLMDAPRFAGNVEAAYRAMWQRWCNM